MANGGGGGGHDSGGGPSSEWNIRVLKTICDHFCGEEPVLS